MTKQIISQNSSDSQYYHPDFHIAFNYVIDYLHKNFGDKAVREYLKKFANAYFAPLKKALTDKGLFSVKEHYEKIFQIEKNNKNKTPFGRIKDGGFPDCI